MSKKIKYTNENFGELREIKDFLPTPEELILKERNQKVTISLSKSSLDFFKEYGERNKIPYQKLIRSLLNSYAERHLYLNDGK